MKIDKSELDILEIYALTVKLQELEELMKDRHFNSDEEAKEAGLKSGDYYRIRDCGEPYFLPLGVIKRVL